MTINAVNAMIFENDCLLGSYAVKSHRNRLTFQGFLLPPTHRPDDEGAKHLRNTGKFLQDYMIQHPSDRYLHTHCHKNGKFQATIFIHSHTKYIIF
jgi:hypothetical protein